MDFFIMRHPQTEWNKVGLLQGHLDSPLTKFGVETANMVGKKMVGKEVTRIISSDLGRCTQTSVIVNEYLHVPIEYTDALREQDFGVLSGKPKNASGTSKDWSDHTYIWEDGESFLQMKARALACIRASLREYSGETLLFSAHDGTLRALLSEVFSCDISDSRCKVTQGDVAQCSIDGEKFIYIQTF